MLCYHEINLWQEKSMDVIFLIVLLILSVVIHEVCHGYAAEALGDPTARYAGRLTLNPIAHIDPIGSVIVPFILAIIPPHVVFGWAKPVPVNPYNLKNQKWGEALVAAAGPGANLAIAIIFGLAVRFNGAFVVMSPYFVTIAASLVFINLLLAIFNLMPIPPLDGSKVLFAFLPYRFAGARQWVERYSLVLFLVLILFLWQFVSPVIAFLFKLVTGIAL